MHFVFDMDGTIVDSRAAVVEAYRLAGIKYPPEAWGKTWRDWCPPGVHDMKGRHYPDVLRRMGRVLPAADLLRITHGTVVTSASDLAVFAVEDLVGFRFKHRCGLDADNKVSIVKVIDDGSGLIYVDDDRDFGIRVMDETRAHFLHVTDHDGLFMLHRRNERGELQVQRWTLSSWLPDAVIV